MSPTVDEDELGHPLSLSRTVSQDLEGCAKEAADLGSPQQPEDQPRAYCLPDSSLAGGLGHVLQLALLHCAGQWDNELWLLAPCARTEGHGWNLEYPLGQGGAEGPWAMRRSMGLRHIKDIWGLV